MNTRYCTNCLLHQLLAASLSACSPGNLPTSCCCICCLAIIQAAILTLSFASLDLSSVSASGLPRDLTNSSLAARKRGQTRSVAPCRPTHLSNKGNQSLGPSSSRRGRPETIHAPREGLGEMVSHTRPGVSQAIWRCPG